MVHEINGTHYFPWKQTHIGPWLPGRIIFEYRFDFADILRKLKKNPCYERNNGERDSVALLRRPLNIANFNKLRYINDKIDLEGRLLLLGQLDADRVVGAGVGDLEAAAVGLVLQETHIRDFHIFIKIFVSSVPYPTNEFWSFFQGKQ